MCKAYTYRVSPSSKNKYGEILNGRNSCHFMTVDGVTVEKMFRFRGALTRCALIFPLMAKSLKHTILRKENLCQRFQKRMSLDTRCVSE